MITTEAMIVITGQQFVIDTAPGQLRGPTGLTPYAEWLTYGNTGTYEDFLASIGGGAQPGGGVSPAKTIVELESTYLASDHARQTVFITDLGGVPGYSDGQHWRLFTSNEAVDIAPNPLKAATLYNPIFYGIDSEYSNLRGYRTDTEHTLSFATKSVAFTFINACLKGNSTGEMQSTGNGIPMAKVSVQAFGVSVPVTWAGSRTHTVADGEGDAACDEIPASAFGVSAIPAGTVLLFKVEVLFAGDAVVPYSFRPSNETANTRFWRYDPTATQISDVDATGATTFTGAAPMSRNGGWHPIVIGRAVSRSAKAIGAIGDSITAGTGDALLENGMGWFQRAIKKFSAKPGTINFGVASSFTVAGSTDSRIMNLITKYTPDGVSVFYGTNDLLFAVDGVTAATVKAKIDARVAQIKAAGVLKVSVSKLIACTVSSNNFTDENGQTAANAQWAAGGPVQQLNALIDASGYDLVLSNTAIIGIDPSKWKALNTDEGLHPNSTGHDNKAASNAPPMEAFFSAA